MLMVSGIGPEETLNSLGIEVLSDRPGVGQNMWVCYTASAVFRRAIVTPMSCERESVYDYHVGPTT